MSDELPIGGNSAATLAAYIERIERLEAEKTGIADDIKDVYLEAKVGGFDTKSMRYAIRLRKMDKEARDEMLALQETYLVALGLA